MGLPSFFVFKVFRLPRLLWRVRICSPLSYWSWHGRRASDRWAENEFGVYQTVTLSGYSDVATSRIKVSIEPEASGPFLVFAFLVLTTIFPPATVKARMS